VGRERHHCLLGSDLLSDGLLGGAVDDGAKSLELRLEVLDVLDTAVELDEATEVSLGSAEDLDLADKDVLEGVDALGLLLDLAADSLRSELGDERRDVRGGDLLVDNLDHLLADLADLAGSRVRRNALLVGAALGGRDGEEAEDVAISGLDIREALDEGLLLADDGAELVRGHVHAVERSEALGALDIVDLEGELAEVLALGVEVTEVGLKDTAEETLARGALADGAGGGGLANNALLEVLGGLEGEPLLAGEGVDAVRVRAKQKRGLRSEKA